MGTEIFKKIKEFTVKETGIKESKVTEDASLEKDLGISGDDAVDYIVAFSKKFNVDISNFMGADYISGEGIDIISPIIRLFTKKTEKIQKELTMRHLEKAVIAGRLDEEVISS